LSSSPPVCAAMNVINTLGQLGKFAASKIIGYDKASQWKPEMGSLYDYKVTDIDVKEYDLNQLRGKVSLVCNVASECGYTGCGYKFLEEEQTKYHDRGFTVLGFPCNQFGGQEPGDNKDIKDFAEKSFQVTFPLFAKNDVNGKNTQPIFKYLKDVYPGDVTWNFHGMFIINEDGIPIKRFQHQKYPEIDASIKQALDDRDAKHKTHTENTNNTTLPTTTQEPTPAAITPAVAAAPVAAS